MHTQHTPAEILRLDLEGIYIGNLNTVDSDLTLPEQGAHGSLFTWETGEDRFITSGGKVCRPIYGMGDRKVELTVTARFQGETAQRHFTATVIQESRETVVAELDLVELRMAPGEGRTLPSVVIARCTDGRRITLPVKWEDWTPLARPGVLEVTGTAAGTEIAARARIAFGPAEEQPGPRRQAEYFPMDQVRLLPGTIYYENQRRMLAYLLSVDDDQMLYNFRKTAGLSTQEAEPMTGWDADDSKLKGHTTGHYLSGLALAYAAAGDGRLLEKIGYMVSELAKCQDALAASGQYAPGFLSAYSEEQFDQLERFVKYPKIWAPYYTLEKIMSGLYDCHTLAGNAQALDILTRMGDWVYRRLSRLTKETLDAMWSMYMSGEFGGMLGTMVKLYRLTGKPEHLEAARLFWNEKLFYPMSRGVDTLEDMHANQHIPQILGVAELYRTAGEEESWRVARNFWDIVTGRHAYRIGGVGESELFHKAGTTSRYLTDKAAESCASYNLLRLTGLLFPYTLDGGMLDYYENTLCNHIMTSCSHDGSGGTTYFLPLGPGGVKEYSTEENTCCHGTGMESRFRYMENIFAQDEGSIYVALLVDAVLSGVLEVRTITPGTIQIQALADMEKGLKIHIPPWAQEELTAERNGGALTPRVENGFLTLPEPLKAGDKVILRMPMELRQLEDPSDGDLVNLAWGPYLLAALDERKDLLTVEAEELRPEEGAFFRAGKVRLMPFPMVDKDPYHVYFRKAKT